MSPTIFKALLLSLLLATPALPQVGKLLPSDEAAKDPELFAVRARLQAAVARHDAEAVLALVDPNIKIGFGGNDGVAQFQRSWNLPSPDSRLWDELGTVLALGGSFQGEDNFVAPYIYKSWPEAFDSFEHVAVLGTGVRVRAEPSLQGAVLTSLSFDIVKLSQSGRSRLNPQQAEEWTAVELRGGRTGFISSRFVRSPVDYRAFLSRQGGRWRLTFFVAGD